MQADVRPGLAGYWGPATATVDWCESNYVVTWYVAEFFNTLTSLFIVAAGALPLALHAHMWALIEWRFVFAFGSLCIVGLGSVAFHGTLSFRHQMLDEVPMLWSVVVILYCLLEHHSRERAYGPVLPACLASYAALATYATSQQAGMAQWSSFHTLFALCEVAGLALVCLFYTRLNESEQAVRMLLRRGFLAYLFAIVMWMLDLTCCARLQRAPGYDYWNFHAFGWHLWTSYGLYSMLLGVWYHRLRSVLRAEVGLLMGAIPRIVHKPER